MKKYLYILSIFIFLIPQLSNAEDFLGAPLVGQGKILQKTDSRLEMKTSLSHDELLVFYREALKGLDDIKFRDWKEATYIEDDGKLPWHSITISKKDDGGATVVVMKDSWTWIIGTLILRYIGVFVVLLFLLLGMVVSGAIISRSVKRMEAKQG
jgi:hypothetical protein